MPVHEYITYSRSLKDLYDERTTKDIVSVVDHSLANRRACKDRKKQAIRPSVRETAHPRPTRTRTITQSHVTTLSPPSQPRRSSSLLSSLSYAHYTHIHIAHTCIPVPFTHMPITRATPLSQAPPNLVTSTPSAGCYALIGCVNEPRHVSSRTSLAGEMDCELQGRRRLEGTRR